MNRISQPPTTTNDRNPSPILIRRKKGPMECPPTRRSARTDLYLTEEILVDQSESETRNCSIQSVGRTSNKNNSVRSLEMSSSGVPLAKDIRLTRRSSTSDESLSGSVQLVSDYPPTPPSMHPGQQFLPKRILAEWSIPPTMDLSPKSLTSSSPDLSNPASIDVSLVAVTCQEEEQRRRCRRRSVSWKRRYRSLSLSCPPLMKKYSTIQRLRKRRRSSLIKREKCQSIDDEQIRELLVELLDEVTSMESRDPRKKLSTEIIHELIRGAKGLDRLSYSVKSLTETMETFLHLSTNKQSIKLVHLREELEKKCPSQFDRAQVFCTRKIQYFLQKHSILSDERSIDQISDIVQYFYLFILALNCRKQEVEFESILNEILLGQRRFDEQRVPSSSILTNLIENFILHSSFVNEYLGAQPLIIDQIEYALPWITNLHLEKEILQQNDASVNTNPFGNLDEFNHYLNECEHRSRTPSSSLPVQQHYSPYYYHHHHHPYYPPYQYSHSSSSYGTVYNTSDQVNYYYPSNSNSSHAAASHRSLQTAMPRIYPNGGHDQR